MPARLMVKALLVMLLSLTACDHVPIGRDQQDAAQYAAQDASIDRMVVANGADAPTTDAQVTADTRTTLAPLDATSPMLDTPLATVPDAALDATPDAASDAAGIVPCVRNDDCDTYVDYCAATCGVCKPTAANPVGRVACLPPANVSCINACAGKVALCLQGRCTIQ